jgi:glutamyl-tRNA synthetase
VPGPRVRFAPSPTGYFHVGSARTALFNWFVARQADGRFILRIEDTDAERNREEWVDGIIASMSWLGLTWDEGPFRQSDNAPAHAAAIAALLAAGDLYYCDCTGDDVLSRKGDDKTPGYDGFCRDRGLAKGPTTGLRFRTPLEGAVVVHDLVRGEVTFSQSVLDDFIVAKSSGVVLYALANVVDDRNDGVTHIIRGEEHLPNAPKQMMLWTALNKATGEDVPLPIYAHLALLVNEQRKKLSKRKDPVATEMYRDQGYLPEAFVNYLALLGWSPKGDEELVPLHRLIQEFDLTQVSHSPAFFDVKKLQHMNGAYIRALDADSFLRVARPWVDPAAGEWRPSEGGPTWPAERFDLDTWVKVAPLVQERVMLLSEIPAMIDFFFLERPVFAEGAREKAFNDDLAGAILADLRRGLAEVAFEPGALHDWVQATGEARGWNLRKTQAPLRVALTGRLVGPPLFESMVLLGRSTVAARLDAVG